MNFKPIVLSFILAVPGLCPGATLSPEDALGRAMSDFNIHKIKSLTPSDYILLDLKSINGQPALYLFNKTDDSGFMIVSADDSAPALLGYSNSGALPADNRNLPDGFVYWLDFLTRRVEDAKTVDNAVNHKINRPKRESIPPLCSTQWDQTEPFNSLCPENYPTGCVATAMAQVMKYHNWPETGTGSNSYEWAGSTLSSNFSEVTFQWNNMVDCYEVNSYTPDQGEAVATLMAQVGIAVNMNYDPTASGTSVVYQAPALGEYFGYDKSKLNTIYRPFYTLNDWEEIIYTNLVNYGPVIYNGRTNEDGGHCFVCDGYDDNGYFHINWGWSGLSDGYFLLDILNPNEQGTGGYQNQSGYCYEQGVVIGITPDQVGNSEWNAYLISTAQIVIDCDEEYESGGKVAVYVNGYNMIYNSGPGTLSADTELGLMFVSLNDNEFFIEPVCVGEEIPMLAGMRGFYFPIPAELPDGDYLSYLAYRDKCEEWTKIPVPVFDSQDFITSVKDGKVNFTPNQYIRLEGENLTFPDEVYDIDLATRLEFPISCTVINPTDKSFYSYLQPLIINDDYEIVAYGEEEVISLDAGESFLYDVEVPFYNFHAPCGEYMFVLTTRTSYTYEIIAYKPIKIISFYGDDGVESIVDDDNIQEEIYYDLMGSRIVNPKSGTMVIKKKGNTYSKIIMP